MFNKQDQRKDAFMLTGQLAQEGYDWWWHSFTAVNERTKEEKSFFIEFFTCNPELGTNAPVFGQSEESKKLGRKPSYLMVKVGCWGDNHVQLHRFFSWDEVSMHKNAPVSIACGDCFMSEYELRGSVTVTDEEADTHPEWMSDAGSMSWDLCLNKQIAFNVGYCTSEPVRELNIFDMYWHAQGMKTLFSGRVVLNGERYVVMPATSFGYSDKNWGCDFTSPWIWLSSSDIITKHSKKRLYNTSFDIGGGRPVILGHPINDVLLGAFYYEGCEYEFNFSKFWTGSHTKFMTKETKEYIYWHVRQESTRSLVDVKVKCKKSEMMLVNYEAPNGSKLHNKLWNGGNGTGIIKLYEKYPDGLYLVDEMIANHVGCEAGYYEEDERGRMVE